MKLSLSKINLSRAGWLSIVTGPLIIPLTFYSAFRGINGVFEPSFMEIAFSVYYTAVNVYVYLLFKELLNKKFHFHKLDTYLLFWLGLGVVTTLLQVIDYVFGGGLTIFYSLLMTLLLIPSSIATIICGKRLLSLEDDLYGLRITLGKTTIVCGVLLLTIILAPLALIAGAITDILVGRILLRAANATATV